MKVFQQIEISMKDYLKFEHEGLNWAIHLETFEIWHYETGIKCEHSFKGSKYRTIVKRFKTYCSESDRLKSTIKMINKGKKYNGQE